MKACVSNQMSQ